MKQEKMSLSDFYKKCLTSARKEGFMWVVSLIARNADAMETMQMIETHWDSLNDLTGKKILFVFSANNMEEATFFSCGNDGTAKICPYGLVMGNNNIGHGRTVYSPDTGQYKPTQDWKDLHTQSIREFAEDFNIKEKDIPCLLFVHLESDKRKLIKIDENTNVYAIIKQFISSIENELLNYSRVNEQIEQIEEYRQINKYMELRERLYEDARISDSAEERKAIINVIENHVNYLEVKEKIRNTKVRKNLKRLKQWDRHFFDELRKSDKYVKYNEMIDEISRLKTILDHAIDNLDSIYKDVSRKEREKMNTDRNIVVNVSGGIANIAGENGTINVTQNNNANDTHELELIVRKIEKELDKISCDDREKITSAIDIVKDEIEKEQPRSAIFRSCITLLSPMISILNGVPVLTDNIGELINIINQYIR